jgi:hypothetical protein
VLASSTAAVGAREAIARNRDALNRSEAKLVRTRAQLDRDVNRRVRDQEAVDREVEVTLDDGWRT